MQHGRCMVETAAFARWFGRVCGGGRRACRRLRRLQVLMRSATRAGLNCDLHDDDRSTIATGPNSINSSCLPSAAAHCLYENTKINNKSGVAAALCWLVEVLQSSQHCPDRRISCPSRVFDQELLLLLLLQVSSWTLQHLLT